MLVTIDAVCQVSASGTAPSSASALSAAALSASITEATSALSRPRSSRDPAAVAAVSAAVTPRLCDSCPAQPRRASSNAPASISWNPPPGSVDTQFAAASNSPPITMLIDRPTGSASNWAANEPGAYGVGPTRAAETAALAPEADTAGSAEITSAVPEVTVESATADGAATGTATAEAAGNVEALAGGAGSGPGAASEPEDGSTGTICTDRESTCTDRESTPRTWIRGAATAAAAGPAARDDVDGTVCAATWPSPARWDGCGAPERVRPPSPGRVTAGRCADEEDTDPDDPPLPELTREESSAEATSGLPINQHPAARANPANRKGPGAIRQSLSVVEDPTVLAGQRDMRNTRFRRIANKCPGTTCYTAAAGSQIGAGNSAGEAALPFIQSTWAPTTAQENDQP